MDVDKTVYYIFILCALLIAVSYSAGLSSDLNALLAGVSNLVTVLTGQGGTARGGAAARKVTVTHG